MKKHAIFAIAVVLVLSCIGFNIPISHGQTTNVNSNTKIVAYGDSLVVGVGSTSGNDFVSILSRRLGITITNAGVSGLTSAQAVASVDSVVVAQDPDIVILVLGGNDVLQNVPRETMMANLRTIIQHIQNGGAKVILVGEHGSVFGADLESLYSNLAVETGASYVPAVLSGILGNPLYMSDLIHPNDAGYQIMADRIFPVLQSTINALPTPQALTVTCRASRTAAPVNQSVSWTAFATGGDGNYRYSWTGTDGLTGSSSVVTKFYSTAGTKTASVTVTSGTSTVSTIETCTDSVVVSEPVITGSCSVNAFSTPTGYTITFNSIVFGSPTTTIVSWTGDDGLVGSSTSVTKTYTTAGVKSATATMLSGNQTLTLTCSASLDPRNIATTSLSWSGNCNSSASGLLVNWSGFSSGPGSPYTYSWTGSEGLVGSSTSVTKTYTTAGVKSATLQAQGINGESHALTCQASVAPFPTNGGNTTGGCFIATAAFGTELDPHVVTLRNFRDEKLLTTRAGTQFVQQYYKYSPPVADYIKDKEGLKSIVRGVLWPVIYLIEP